ncbi:MAG: Rpn family recombination-promoting nuclease/putative transposase [Lachnospiraceae bacterium]|nr:Rpn family recombination-promoting nuclease/putative transposase [Lachnospiraceae bacterium]
MKTLEEQMELVQSLNVMDDIFFHKIAEDREVCEEILRIILEMPELKVIQSQVQRFLRNNGAHSVILDALCELGDGSEANIEVQKADDDNHQKRVRFNQSNIDTTFTEKGIKYEELPDTYMVFISKFDIFAKGRTIYHVDRVIRETGDAVENGVHEVYVNVAVNDGSEIAGLMQYFRDSNGMDGRFAKLCGRVDYFKHEKEGVRIMATLFEKYVTEEVAEATAEEQKKGIRNIAKTYHKFNQSYEAARESALEEYPNVDETLIDEILDDVYGLVK